MCDTLVTREGHVDACGWAITLSHDDVRQELQLAKSHVRVCGPTTVRGYADVYGPCYPLK